MDSSYRWEERNNSSTSITSKNNFQQQLVKFESSSTDGDSTNLQQLPTVCKEEQSIFRYCEGNLNFATVATDEDDFGFHKKKALARDPMSHRIIEKRRRDRMNNCLADLSRLIPAEYLKKGRGRVEKTEIIEMAIKHMKHLQSHACHHTDSCELVHETEPQPGPVVIEHYRLGYQECLSETMHFLVEVEGFFAGDSLCVQLINHLQKHCDKILKGDRLNFPRPHRSGENNSTSSGSSRCYSGYSGGASSTSSGSDSGGNGHKESSAGHTVWRQNGEVELETPSPIPLPSPHSVVGLQTLPPPPPPPSNAPGLSEQDDSLMSLPSSETEPSTSQLRDMLTGASSITPRRTQDVSDSGSLYKFKNNIKQRFSAEHGDEKRRRISTSDGGNDMDSPQPQSELVSIKRQNSPSPTPPTPQMASSSTCSSTPPSQSYGVPVFALHTKGSFYIPLTIDNEMLSPYMGAFGEHNQVLHPVTISVNFCGLNAAMPAQEAPPMIPWRGEPPALTPVPKWSCDRG